MSTKTTTHMSRTSISYLVPLKKIKIQEWRWVYAMVMVPRTARLPLWETIARSRTARTTARSTAGVPSNSLSRDACVIRYAIECIVSRRLHGICVQGYFGEVCQYKQCLNNCTWPNGECNITSGMCNCRMTYSPYLNTRYAIVCAPCDIS